MISESWQFAQRTQGMKASAIREILKVTSQPGVISFAGGLPAADLFPMQAITQTTQQVLAQHGTSALQYSTTEGYLPLREWVAAQLPNTKASQVQIVSGSQQGLDLLGKVLLDQNDTVLVEAPTYLGAISSFNPYCPKYVSVPLDANGIDVEQLETVLKSQRIKFMYLLPTFQNPSGALMPLERRRQVVALARAYKVPILEDDAYHYLGFDNEHLPTLYGLDQEQGGGNVVYMSTQSKILAPGLRVAWVVGPEELIQKLVFAKQGADLHTPTLNQMVVSELLNNQEFLQQQIARTKATYKERCYAMADAIKTHLPSNFSYQIPRGGMFFWVEAPKEVNALEVFKRAVELKVAFVPGQPFYIEPDQGLNTLRFSYSVATPEQLQTGMQRLAQAIHSLNN